MLTFMNIEAKEATLNCHEMLAPISLAMSLLFFLEKINLLR